LARSRVLRPRLDARLAAKLQPWLKLVGDLLQNFSIRYLSTAPITDSYSTVGRSPFGR
jgi:hypothetical protein